MNMTQFGKKLQVLIKSPQKERQKLQFLCIKNQHTCIINLYARTPLIMNLCCGRYILHTRPTATLGEKRLTKQSPARCDQPLESAMLRAQIVVSAMKAPQKHLVCRVRLRRVAGVEQLIGAHQVGMQAVVDGTLVCFQTGACVHPSGQEDHPVAWAEFRSIIVKVVCDVVYPILSLRSLLMQ